MDMGLSNYKKKQPFILANLLLQGFMVLVFSQSTTASSGPSSFLLCQKPTLPESVLARHGQCLLMDQWRAGNVDLITSRVAEVNGTTLERALSIIQRSNDAYVSVLFYAQWCPFSKSARPTFDELSILFPAIYHVAVEESALRARYHTISGLSQYGVHSFPSLFLHNKTLRIRYYGPKTVEALSHFYRNITGMQPFASGSFEERMNAKQKGTEGVPDMVESHPYLRVKSPKKWLNDDMYLTLATLFLVLRIFHYIVPKVVSRIKQYCAEKIYVLQAAKAVIRGETLLVADREQYTKKNKGDKGKNIRTEIMQEGSTNRRGTFVRSWSSSSLAPVTLAEGSSSRGGTSDEGWESGRTHRVPF